MSRMVRSRACWAKAVSLSKVMDLRRRRSDPSEHGEHDRDGFRGGFSGQPRGERHTGFSFVQDEHGPGALTDDEVAFPMANVGAGFDVFWPIVDRGAVFDHIAWRSRPARPSALVTAGQIAPEFLALASGAIDEGVDGLDPRARRPRSWPALSQPAICSGVHPSARRSRTKSLNCDPFRGWLHATCAVDRLRRREAANSARSAGRCVAVPAIRSIRTQALTYSRLIESLSAIARLANSANEAGNPAVFPCSKDSAGISPPNSSLVSSA